MPVLSLACHLPHNTPNIPSRYKNKQTTKQTKAINNSYIYINISCKCDTNRAGHFTLDAYASRPVACMLYMVLAFRLHWTWPVNHLQGQCWIKTQMAFHKCSPVPLHFGTRLPAATERGRVCEPHALGVHNTWCYLTIPMLPHMLYMVLAFRLHWTWPVNHLQGQRLNRAPVSIDSSATKLLDQGLSRAHYYSVPTPPVSIYHHHVEGENYSLHQSGIHWINGVLRRVTSRQLLGQYGREFSLRARYENGCW